MKYWSFFNLIFNFSFYNHFFWGEVSSIRHYVSSPDETPRSSSKILCCARVVFSTLFSVFHLVMKHCVSCLIYYRGTVRCVTRRAFFSMSSLNPPKFSFIINVVKWKNARKAHCLWRTIWRTFSRTEQYYYRCIYFEALDLIENGIQSRLFNQGIKSVQILKTSLSRQFQEKISQVGHYQPAAFMIRYKQGTSWNAFYYFENACSRTFHSSVSSIIDLLKANGRAFVSETATV